MSMNYDNWERLVRVVLRRESDRQLALTHSWDFSSLSSSSISTFDLSLRSTAQFDEDEDEWSDVHPLERPISAMKYDSNLRLDHRDWRIAMSDILWTMMLPPHEQEAVWRSTSMSFFVDQMTGKNCFLLGMRHLKIPDKSVVRKYPHPESRFSEVVELKYSQDLHIEAMIMKQMLSPDTLYKAYLVVGFPEKQDRLVQFEPGYITAVRWMEIELNIFYVGLEGEGELEIVFMGTDEFWEARWLERDPYRRSRLIVEGIGRSSLKACRLIALSLEVSRFGI